MSAYRKFVRRRLLALAALWAVSVPLTYAQVPHNASPKGRDQKRSHAPNRAEGKALQAGACGTAGDDEITITCAYEAARHPSGNDLNPPQVTINQAVFSLEPNDSSNLRIKLTFTKTSAIPVSEARTVYIAIDDNAGNNYVRRVLPTVAFRKLDVGKPVTFTEELRVAKFPPGHYTIALWIPSQDKASQFNPARNWMIGGAGVADPKSGLNILAKFTVEDRHNKTQ